MLFVAGPTDAKVSAITTKQIEDADGPQVHATGVTYAGKDGAEHTIEADAVVLCTGGYGADSHGPGALLSKYAPTYKLLPTTNGAFATGDGVRLAAAAGGRQHGANCSTAATWARRRAGCTPRRWLPGRLPRVPACGGGRACSVAVRR